MKKYFSETPPVAPPAAPQNQTVDETLPQMVPFARAGPSAAREKKTEEKKKCPVCGTGFHKARNNYVICQLCSSWFHKKKCAGKLSGLNGANNFVCPSCNPEDETSRPPRGRGRGGRNRGAGRAPLQPVPLPAGRGGAQVRGRGGGRGRGRTPSGDGPSLPPRLEPVQGLDGGVCPPSGDARGADPSPALTGPPPDHTGHPATVVVPASGLVIDASDIVISSDISHNLELLLQEETQDSLPSYLDNLPKMDRLLGAHGFQRSSTQPMTPAFGDCGPEGN